MIQLNHCEEKIHSKSFEHLSKTSFPRTVSTEILTLKNFVFEGKIICFQLQNKKKTNNNFKAMN